MKTPEEIKHALKLCGRGCYSGCAYNSFECVEEMSRDALAYIQQLEDQFCEAAKKVENIEAAQPKWISIYDELPPVGERVLASIDRIACFEVYVDCNGKWYRAPTGLKVERYLGKVTHWMPMPEPPNDVES